MRPETADRINDLVKVARDARTIRQNYVRSIEDLDQQLREIREEIKTLRREDP